MCLMFWFSSSIVVFSTEFWNKASWGFKTDTLFWLLDKFLWTPSSHKNGFKFLAYEGFLNFLKALISICLTLSTLKLSIIPTCSNVFSSPSTKPHLSEITFFSVSLNALFIILFMFSANWSLKIFDSFAKALS